MRGVVTKINGLLDSSIEVKCIKTIAGRGRGKRIGIPTINLSLEDIPKGFPHGIYAGRVRIGKQWHDAAIHYGPRPVFKDDVTFEIHLIESVVSTAPETVDLQVVGRLRDVLDFESPKLLVRQIEKDIQQTRDMLSRA